MSFLAEIELVPKEHVLDVWPICGGFIEQACKRGPCEFEPLQLRDECSRGERNLWVIGIDGECVAAIVTTVHESNGQKVMTWTALGGRYMDLWEHLERTIADMAKAHGVNIMRGFGRLAWKKKAPGYREVGTIIEKDLG